MKFLHHATFFVAICFSSATTFAQKVYYWNPSSNNKSSNAGNWHLSSCTGATGTPGKNDSVVFTSCNIPNPNCTIDKALNVAGMRLAADYNGTVTVNPGKKITVQAAKFSGGKFIGNTADIIVNSSFTINGSNFTSSSGNLSIKGPFTFLSGSFTHNKGTIIFNKGTAAVTELSGLQNASSITFNNVQFAGSGSKTKFSIDNITFNVSGTLTLTGTSPLFINTTTHAVINAQGNFIVQNNAADGGGSAAIVINGSKYQKIEDLQSGNLFGRIGNITISKTQDTLHLIGNIELGKGSIWEYHSGNVDVGTSKLICFNQNTLNNSSSGKMNLYDLEMQGNGSDHTVKGTVTVNHTFSTSLTSSDKINAGTGGGTLELFGDLQWNNTSTSFGTVAWKFSGGATQYLSGSIEPTLYDVTMNKNDFYLVLQKGFSVSHQLNLLTGYIVSDSLHAVTIQNGASVINASANSFIRGAAKKTGLNAFQFPIGAGLKYRPIAISAPLGTNDIFYAAYHDEEQSVSNNKDTSLSYISQCEYWTLTHLSGTSAVNITMYWDSLTCDIDTVPTLRIAGYKASVGKWVNLGNVTSTGNTSSGSITTQASQSTFSNFLIAKNSAKPIVNAGRDTSACSGTALILGGTPSAIGGKPPYDYHWTPDTNLSSDSAANPTATLQDTIDYVLTVTDAEGVQLNDTIHINVFPAPAVDAGHDRFVSFGSSTILSSENAVTGGTATFVYSWSPASYLDQTNILQPVAAPLSSITYTLTVTDIHGCVMNDRVNVLMNIPSLRSAGMFGLLSADSILFSNPTLISAKVGARKFISASVTSDDTIVIGSALDSIAINDLSDAISQIKSLNGVEIDSSLGGQVLTSGTYTVNSNATLKSTLTLQGDAKSFFIISISDSLTVNDDGVIVLNGVSRSQVYFHIGGNLKVASSADLPGIFLVEGEISGGNISSATLLCLSKIAITSANSTSAVYTAKLTDNTRTDAAEFLGFNSNNLFKVADNDNPTNLSDHNDRLHMPQLNARVVRFPPGGQTKSWNMNDGWFFSMDEAADPSQISYSSNLACVSAIDPVDAKAFPGLPVDRLIDLRYCLEGSDAKLMMCINMFTNTDFQKNILQHAMDLGINMPYVELGNEFYLRGGTCPWVQPEDYAGEVNYWLNYIHNTPSLKGVHVGFVGGAWTTEDDITDDNDCRRKAWDASVFPNITGTLPGDAVTYHIYPTTGIDPSKAPVVTLQDIPTLFSKAFTAIDNFSNHELKTTEDYPDLDVWVSEYNLTDKNFIIAGSWAHALFLATLTMRLLEFPIIKTAECHTFAYTAGHGLFFSNAQAYKLGPAWASIDTSTVTKPWAFTSTGLAIKMIADAMRFSNKATMLNFPHSPLIKNSNHPVLYGWTFDKDFGDKQSVILNLGDQPQQVDISYLKPADAYEQVWCNNPLTFFTGNILWKPPYNNYYNAVNYDYNTTNETPVNFDSVQVKIQNGITTIYLPPYSITRLYAMNTSGVWMQQSGTSVCARDMNGSDTAHASTAVNLHAGGGAYYQWSVGEKEKSTASNISVGPTTSIVNGQLKVFDAEGNLIGTKNDIPISQSALPDLSVTPASFDNLNGASVTINASGASAYNWMPSFGASSILGNTVIIKPPYSQTYYVIGTAGNYCSKIEKIHATIFPVINITSSVTLNNNLNPQSLHICRGNPLTLTADGDADYYVWTSNDSSVNGKGPSITFTPSKNVLVTVQATNRLLNETSRSSVYIAVNPSVATDLNDFYGCANQFVSIHGSLVNAGPNTTFCWDDLMPGTSLYKTKSFSNPIIENSCKTSYSRVYFNAPAGTYTMDFKAQNPDAGLCPNVQNDDLFNVHLNNVPPDLILPQNLCAINGGSVLLTASGGNQDFTWDGPGLEKSIGGSIQVSPTTTSYYKVTTSNQQCCITDSILVSVEQVKANCDGSTYCYGCYSKQVQVVPIDTDNYLYQWFENGVAIEGATDGIYNVTASQDQQVKQSTVYCAVSRKDASCSPGRTNDVEITVTQNCSYQRIAAAHQTSDASQSLSIYPNPASQNFSVTFTQKQTTDEQATLSVYDVMGKVMMREKIILKDGQYSELLHQSFPQGIYLVRICTSEGCTAERLIISQ